MSARSVCAEMGTSHGMEAKAEAVLDLSPAVPTYSEQPSAQRVRLNRPMLARRR